MQWRSFMNKQSNKIIGVQGENQAEQYLKKQGYKILEKNYRYSRYAEIDIIAKDKDTIVFVEVKTRSGLNFGHPFEAINSTKLQNILHAGLYYLKNTQEKYKKYRIDIIGITKILDNQPCKIEHLKDVSLN